LSAREGFEIRDRAELERWLRRDARAHVYALADLDDVFWSDTRWFASRSGLELDAVCLLLEKLALPILYAVSPAGDTAMRRLLGWLRPTLPDRVFATLGVGLSAELAGEFEVESHGQFLKMALDGAGRLGVPEPAGLERLGVAHLDELRAFYAHDAYLPEERHGRFFEPYMLEIGPWFGIREAGRLVSVAGVHVVSARTSVAALGGIATRPDRRGRGLARAVTAVLCRALRDEVELVGLNVAAGNESAIRCYASLGFREVCRYEEMELARRAKR
jgi:ribosomal protein S18 acetylase RimI-like enzyme